MATVLVTCVGSGGDLFPFVALGHELTARGHRPVFAVPPMLAYALVGQGMTVHRLGPMQAATARDSPGIRSSRWRGARSLRAFADDFLLPTIPALARDLDRVAEQERPDVLVSNGWQVMAGSVAARRGVPWASVVVSPSAIPSRAANPLTGSLLGAGALGRRANALVWRRLEAYVGDDVTHAIRAAASEIGASPPEARLLRAGTCAPVTLAAQHDCYAMLPADVRDRCRNVGYPYWDRVARRWDEDALRRFTSRGAPLAVACFGTFMGRDQERVWSTLREAGGRAGMRLVILGASRDLERATESEPDVLAYRYAPLSAVVRHARAVVHQGGAGATHAALRAGVPSVVLPHGFDHFVHAARLRHHGVGLTLARSRLTGDRLQRTLRWALRDATQTRARSLAAAIASDPDPATQICQAIETILPR